MKQARPQASWKWIDLMAVGVMAGVLGCQTANQPWSFAMAEAFAECEGELPEDADPPQVTIGERLFLGIVQQ
jgi:hypothetical protein